MGGKLDPLQSMQIGGQTPLSAKDAHLPEVVPFRKRKEELWQCMNSDRFKERKAALQTEVDFECDQPTGQQVDQEMQEDPEIRKERVTLGKYWEDHFYRDRKANKCLLSSSPVGFVPSPLKPPHLVPPTLSASLNTHLSSLPLIPFHLRRRPKHS
jgi:hypothetical protein